MRRALELALGLGLALVAVEAAGRLLPGGPGSPGEGAPAAQPAQPAQIAQIAQPAGETEPTRERASEVVRYELRASLDPSAHTIHGEGSIVWRNASRTPQRELYVHLYLNAFKNDRTIFLRTTQAGFRGTGPLADYGSIKVRRFFVRELGAEVWPENPTTPGDAEDETDIRVPLPSAVEPGASITIDVAWDARLPSVVLRTGHVGSFHMVGQWFPKLARLEPDGRWAHFPFHRLAEFYADFGAYDVTVDVPEGFVVGATGKLVHEARAGGRVTRRFTQGDVHDFAFTAWDSFLEATDVSDDGVAIRCLYPPGHERSAAIELAVARFGLAHFGRAYGRYPYATLTLVHPPEGAMEAGGMEYPTLITTGGEWFMPLTGARPIEVVTLHELAHQWFYGLVATNELAHPFLDEGLTTYAEMDAMEVLFPGASAFRGAGLSIGLPAAYRADVFEAPRGAIAAQPASAFVTGTDYGALVYSRTSMTLWTLGEVFGADAVRGAIGRYARRHRFEHPGPEDLLAAIREGVGGAAADAARASLVEGGWVDYSVEELMSERASLPGGIFGDPDAPRAAPAGDAPGGAPEGTGAWRGEVLVRRHGTIRLPVDVVFVGEDGGSTRVRWDGAESAARIPYTGSSPLAAAVVDPEHRVLLDEDFRNNATRASRARVGLRVLDQATFAAELGLLVLAP